MKHPILIIGLVLVLIGITWLYLSNSNKGETKETTQTGTVETKTYPKYVGTTDDIAWEDKTERERHLDMTTDISTLSGTDKCRLLASYRYENFSYESLQKHKVPYIWNEEKQSCLDGNEQVINMDDYKKEITIQRKREL